MGQEARAVWADPGWRVELAARAAPVTMLVLAGVSDGALRRVVLALWWVGSAAVAGLMAWRQRPLWRTLPPGAALAVAAPSLAVSVGAWGAAPSALTAAAVAVAASSGAAAAARVTVRRLVTVRPSPGRAGR